MSLLPNALPLIATYRLQLRNGVDLDDARALLPWLGKLGVSHLYLSPPFHAAAGSTHGYDVIDPDRIDPALGGDAAFARLSEAAQLAGIGIVLDIVPNHMGFTPENPYLADVLRHGRESRYATVFDIDWQAIGDGARIHFPVLDGTVAQLLADGQIGIAGTPDDPRLRVYDREYPLRLTEQAAYLAGISRTLDAATLDALLAEQHWSLGHWRDGDRTITHRRFFNISDLIGVRQEDPEVFALTHRWIVEQVRAGHVQGLRVDHIDGLARPGGYLHHLREAVGDVPAWVEKIVKDAEPLAPNWPVEGMSGYEFMTPVTRLLTHPDGLGTLREAAEDAVPPSYGREVRKVRRELLDAVFVPERERVADAAMAALAIDAEARPGVVEAVCRLATAWPVYRSYAADLSPLSPAIAEAVADACDQPLVACLLDLLRATDDALARTFATRFEQLTGALTAKSEEDTVFFRSVAYLPLCEVGAEPDLDAIDRAAFEAAMAERARLTPLALNALSTHDTKRSADARAVLVALSHFPALARDLYAEARSRAVAAGVPEHWGLYALQTALMLRSEPEADTRIADHIAKAMREGKELSRHEDPDTATEAAVADLCRALHGDLPARLGAGFEEMVEAVTLAQVALQLTAPGIPDIYQGTEGLSVGLTDPDNRRPVAWDTLEHAEGGGDLNARKLRLTRDLLARRRAAPNLFARGSYRLHNDDGIWTVEREWQGQSVWVRIPMPASAATARPDALLPV
ncbi:malto-oligosyltrehalose synthase [Novosphingobium kaempferiae]|uniref:malto-oligosyltrehalose synthase n=1 Tax=Novosphingobium kaempferiae TaxID=2896849 RepID=UPI001E33FA82|nr:malto-oligosyltrehalose synthase [Novosphingobium kaempferiae]